MEYEEAVRKKLIGVFINFKKYWKGIWAGIVVFLYLSFIYLIFR